VEIHQDLLQQKLPLKCIQKKLQEPLNLRKNTGRNTGIKQITSHDTKAYVERPLMAISTNSISLAERPLSLDSGRL